LKYLVLLALSICCFAQADGPATLPRSVPSLVAVSPNPPTLVPATASLQVAFNAAQCGDVLSVDPASAQVAVSLVPAQPCDAGHWITVQSSTAINLDPATGRVVPGQQLPKIIISQQNGRVTLGSFVALIGFEITRPAGTGIVYDLVLPAPGAHDIILNYVYCHGTPGDETNRCISTSGATRLAITNSVMTDIHCMALMGACGDSQGIAGGTTSGNDEGVFAILNNYIEASTQCMIFGGGGATVVPHDITIMGNECVKPLSWNPSDPSYKPVIGHDGLPHPWVVKNCMELKNAAYVLISGNVCENGWGGFTQIGYAILLTAKSQAGAGGSVCPICSVHDVTVRDSIIRHWGLAIQAGFGPNTLGGWAAGEYNLSVHDLSFEDMNYPTCYQCGHWLFQISSGQSTTGAVGHDWNFRNITVSVPVWHGPNGATDGRGHGLLTLGGPLAPNQMQNINFNNIVSPAGNAPFLSTGGGATNCAYPIQADYSKLLSLCWGGTSSFSGAILTNGQKFPAKVAWPAGTTFVSAGADASVLP
jgi:hypothetical protein